MEKDKELDNLFKRGLDDPGHQPDFREDDWDAMEAMLGGNKKRAGIVYWLPLLGAVAAVLLIVFGLWMFMHKTPENQQTAINRISTKDTSNLKQRHPGTSDGSIQRNERNYASNPDTIAPVANRNRHRNAINPATLASTTTNYGAKGQPTVIPSAGGSRRDITGPGQQPVITTVAAIQPALTSASGIPSFNIKNGVRDTISPANFMPKENYGVAAANKVKAQAIAAGYKPQFAITVLGSSDMNGLNSFSQSKVGTNVGALLSVGVLKRLTISTGAIYSSKPYLTNFDNYRGSFKFPSTPTSVSADCRMIDVPLNLDYSLYNKHRNKFSIGTGVSSYLMFHENYNYSYSGSNANWGAPASYNVPNPGKYYLSILNLQATYQRQINSKLGLDIQPYMKLPLTGVGLYDSKLQSTGVAVGLTWRLGSH